MMMANILMAMAMLACCHGMKPTPPTRKPGKPASNRIAEVDQKFMIFNGVPMSLRELYDGRIPSTPYFKIGVLRSTDRNVRFISGLPMIPDETCPGGVYIDRALSLFPTPWTSAFAEEKATAAGIAAKVIHNPSQVALVLGEKRSGKSVLLQKIRFEVAKAEPALWTVFADVTRIMRIMLAEADGFDERVVQDVITLSVPSRHRGLFLDLYQTNAKRIVFFLDGLGVTIGNSASMVLSLVQRLNAAGATVVASGTLRTLDLFQGRQLYPNAWRIAEMNFHEVLQLTINTWSERARQVPPENRDHPEIESQRLENYAAAFTASLFRTPIPRQLETLRYLLKAVLLANNRKLLRDIITQSATIVPRISKYVRINKRSIYSIFVDRILGYGETESVRDMNTDFAFGELVRQVDIPNWAVAFRNKLHHFLERSEQMLKDQIHRKMLTNYFNGRLEVIHPDIQNYLAAEHVFHSAPDPDYELFSQRIFSSRRYGRVLEFVESHADEALDEIVSYLLQGRYGLLIMDNLLGHGYQRLFMAVLRHYKLSDKIGELRGYFADQEHFPMYRVRRSLGIIETDGYTTLADDPTMYLPTRVELLVDKNMEKAYSELRRLNVISLNQEQYQRLLLFAVTRRESSPSLSFVAKIIESKPEAFSVDYNALLYFAIHEGGPTSRRIVGYLADHVADPHLINIEGRTLLHAAARWSDLGLFSYVVDTLNVPVVDSTGAVDPMVLARVFDANPSPVHTPVGWWRTVQYLVEFIYSSESLVWRPPSDVENIRIPTEDLRSTWFEAMLGTAAISTHEYDLNSLQIQPLSPDDPEFEHQSARVRFTPTAQWGLDEKTLALRRNHLELKFKGHQVSLLEMLVNYRGVEELTPVDRRHYRSAVASLLGKTSLTKQERSRVLHTLMNNIGDVTDLNDFLYFSRRGLLTNDDDDLRTALKAIMRERSRQLIPPGPNMNRILVSDRFLQSRVNYNSRVDGIDQPNSLGDGRPSTSYDQPSTSSAIADCLSPRTRRGLPRLFCHFTWNDVDQFNDGVPRDVSRIQVNSGRFLDTIAGIEPTDFVKAQQLLHLVRHLSDSREIITGEFKLLMHDVLEQGSLLAYRRGQRASSIAIDILETPASSKLRLGVSLPSQAFVAHAAMAFTLVRGLYGTVRTCEQQHNDSSCAYAIGALALAVALPVVDTIGVKFMPQIVHSFSSTALELLPNWVPMTVRDNIKIFRSLGIKYGAKVFSRLLALPGMGFDIYNIVQTSKIIDMCSRDVDGCPSKDKIAAIISLTFSCVSLVVTTALLIIPGGAIVGALIGVALVALESLALGINAVVYYHRNYKTTFKEDVSIFFNEITWRPLPDDVEALVHRTTWVKRLHDRVSQQLESNKNIVAFAVGIGSLRNNQPDAGLSFISMEDSDVENTRGLSRVLPEGRATEMRLCLPKQDKNQEYDKYESTDPDARYKCRNSFVIAEKSRWNTVDRSASAILYDLSYIEEGTIVGSQRFNNLFLIYNGTTRLNVIGGRGSMTNTHMIFTDSFRGSIFLNGHPSYIDLSKVPSPTLTFTWSASLARGSVAFDNDEDNAFEVIRGGQQLSESVILGRANKPDAFMCDWSHSELHGTSISIDSGGGASSSKMDQVTDCKIVTLRPFTHVTGSHSPDRTYITSVTLDGLVRPAINVEAEATIQPLLSNFMLQFSNHPLLFSTINVVYQPVSKILTWNLQYTPSTTLKLSIMPYYVSPENNTQDNPTAQSATCMFIDNYQGLHINPVIDVADNSSATSISIERFHVFRTINSTRLPEVFDNYNDIRALYHPGFFIVTKLINPTANHQAFIFGSDMDDNFLVDATTIFLHGSNGRDTFTIDRQSPMDVWIDNAADDDALDTLILLDTLCSSLHATSGSMESDCCDGSQYDVTLICSDDVSVKMNITLRNYLLDLSHQHLQIVWQNEPRVLITDEGPPGTLELASFFSFDEQWQSVMFNVTNPDDNVVLHGFSENNSLVVHRSGATMTDIYITRKYFDNNIVSFVVLGNFFDNSASDRISARWRNFKMRIVDDGSQSILNATDINFLAVSSDIIGSFSSSETTVTEEYTVNITDPNQSTKVVIDHNNSQDKDNRLAVLVIWGAQPGEFSGLQGPDDSLLLYTNHTQIYIQNWCLSSLHRLHRIEFMKSLRKPPIVIQDLDALECGQKLNSQKLEQRFRCAQYEWLLMDQDADSDGSRLMLCLGTVLSEFIASRSMYQLFNFRSPLEQAKFVRDNCHTLFNQDSMKHVSHAAMYGFLKRATTMFQCNGEPSQSDKESLELVRRKFRQLDESCWRQFLTFASSQDVSTPIGIDNLRASLRDLFNCTSNIT